HLGAHLVPLEVGRVAFLGQAEAVAVDHQGVAIDRHLALEAAVHRVVAQHVGQVIGLEQVVDADDLDVVEVLDRRTQHVAADAAEPVDAYLDRHGARTPGQGWKEAPILAGRSWRSGPRIGARLVASAMIRIKVARRARGHTGAHPTRSSPCSAPPPCCSRPWPRPSPCLPPPSPRATGPSASAPTTSTRSPTTAVSTPPPSAWARCRPPKSATACVPPSPPS